MKRKPNLDCEFIINFDEIRPKPQKKGFFQWLKNRLKLHMFESSLLLKTPQAVSILKIQNFDESRTDETIEKEIRIEFQTKGKHIKELTIVDSTFTSISSFKRFMKLFEHVENVEVKNVNFGHKIPAIEDDNDVKLCKLQKLSIDETDSIFLEAFTCDEVSILDVNLSICEELDGSLKDQMTWLSKFINRQTRLENMTLRNLSEQPAYLYISPNVAFQLKVLAMGNVYFSSAKVALNFLESQYEIQSLTMPLGEDKQEGRYFASYLDLHELMHYIYLNCDNLRRLELSFDRYYFTKTDMPLQAPIYNDSIIGLHYLQRGDFHNVNILRGLTAMAPFVENFTFGDRVTTDEIPDLSAINDMECLDTLVIVANAKALEAITIPDDRLMRFQFWPKDEMTYRDEICLVNFLKRHPAIQSVILHMHISLQLLLQIVEQHVLENAINLVAESLEECAYAVKTLEMFLPKLENLELTEVAIEDLNFSDWVKLRDIHISEDSLFSN